MRPIIQYCLRCLCLCGLLTACQSPAAHITGVWGTKRTNDVSRIDGSLFTHDRATQLRTALRPLTADEQGEEFFVSWTGASVNRIKFEYRQVNIRDKVLNQTCTPTTQRSVIFAVRGADYAKGGAVSAWRASLWQDDQLLTEKTSVLW